MRKTLETKSKEEVLKLVAEQLEATMLEHEKIDEVAAAERQKFDDAPLSPKEARKRPSFYVEGIHLTVDITSNRHDPGAEPDFVVRVSKSY